MRCRLYYVLTKRFILADDTNDPDLQRFYLRACDRASEVPPLLHWKSMFPGLVGPSDIWEVNAQQFGSAVAWGLMHADELLDPSIPPNESAWDEKRRQAARRAEAERITQEYSRLSHEAMEAGTWYGEDGKLLDGARKQAWKLATEAVRRKSEEAGPSNMAVAV